MLHNSPKGEKETTECKMANYFHNVTRPAHYFTMWNDTTKASPFMDFQDSRKEATAAAITEGSIKCTF